MTRTSKSPWLASLAMAVTALPSFTAISTACGATDLEADCKPLPCTGAQMAEYCVADPFMVLSLPVSHTRAEATPAETTPVGEVWDRMRGAFSLPAAAPRAVHRYVREFTRNPVALARALRRGEPYLFYILNRVEARGLPTELVLLPFVESTFDPHATSPAGAAGIWQFMPDTAAELGLSRSWWYDGRMDVVEATEAALDYLTRLHRRFGDWFLALAAYNAGSARIQAAIERNRREGKPADYWHLVLPEETRDYVPKLIALRAVIRDPANYHITLPSVPDTHYFTRVDMQGQIDLQVAARLAGVSEDELRRLNAGIIRLITPPDRPTELLIPTKSEEVFRERLARLPAAKRIHSIRHHILQGDTLSTIAQHYRTTVARLLKVNHLKSTNIIAGEFLVVPGS
jgi:membrane-bound lytic murein transglycosylase D